jgi:hypothetical protein
MLCYINVAGPMRLSPGNNYIATLDKAPDRTYLSFKVK